MGVPAFFRWLALRYPRIVVECVEEVGWLDSGSDLTIDASLPNPNGVEYDNLYLDMNGIIHPCTHPEDRPAPTTEEEMFEEVFRYCDRLMNIVRPRKVLYMAIDGVAPRAKINQQRSRRFRSAKEAGEKQHEDTVLREEWRAAGLEIPEEDGKDAPFDSNVITPGTPFMDRLAAALRRYAADRIKSNPAWSNLKVLFSDASVPGEGEHKIAEFVRQTRAQPGYNANTRHVLYGLDADLIMLGLATHEHHFTILREMVMTAHGRFLDKKEPPRPPTEKINELDTGGELRGLLSDLGGKHPFQFLHIHILREYLDFEFKDALEEGFRRAAKMKQTAPLRYDFERVIDDFVFTCFFVGNDFLPHLPSLDIREGALEFLMELYKILIPEIGYITDGFGNVDFKKVRRLLDDVGAIEDEVFRKRMENEKREARRQEMQKNQKRGFDQSGKDKQDGPPKHKMKVGNDGMQGVVPLVALGQADPTARPKTHSVEAKATNVEVAESLRKRLSTLASKRSDDGAKETEGAETTDALQEKFKNLPSFEVLSQFKEALSGRLKEKATIDSPSDVVRLGEPGWKDRYYQSKFEWGQLTTDEHRKEKENLCRSYLEGLLWVMEYYYKGCVSWTWYFPYHYAPFASDLAEIDFNREEVMMELGKPFSPLEQLMGVLPAMSAKGVIPNAYYNLMVDENSPIIDYYPKDFKVDLNGKRFAWQGVALLPFVDERRLLSALEPVKNMLTTEEARRNTMGDSLILIHRDSQLGKHLKEELESRSEVMVVGKELSGGVVFGKAKKVPDDLHIGAMMVAQYDLPYPPSVHNPRPRPGSEPSVPTITDAEFSEVRSGQTGWRVAKHGALGQAARRLADTRRYAGNEGEIGQRRGRDSNQNHGRPPKQERGWGNNMDRIAPGFVPAYPPSTWNQGNAAAGPAGVNATGGLAGPTAAALRRAATTGGRGEYSSRGNYGYSNFSGGGNDNYRGGGGSGDNYRVGGGGDNYRSGNASDNYSSGRGNNTYYANRGAGAGGYENYQTSSGNYRGGGGGGGRGYDRHNNNFGYDNRGGYGANRTHSHQNRGSSQGGDFHQRQRNNGSGGRYSNR